MTHYFIAAAILLLLMGSGQPASATNFPAIGGSGDATAVDRCPPGMYLVGLKGRKGVWIDQVQIVCAPVTPAVYGAGFDPNPVSGGTGRKWYGPIRGGNGGAPVENGCWTGEVVTTAGFWISPSKQVISIYLPCSPVGTHAIGRSEAGFEGSRTAMGATELANTSCPAGETATGFTIRYGKAVNAMGLICEHRP